MLGAAYVDHVALALGGAVLALKVPTAVAVALVLESKKCNFEKEKRYFEFLRHCIRHTTLTCTLRGRTHKEKSNLLFRKNRLILISLCVRSLDLKRNSSLCNQL